MNKVYSRIVWENFPSEKTALNERNLNRMDLAIDNLDDRVIQMDSTKVNKEVANNLVKTWSIDEETGIITVEHLDGSRDIFDLNIEKIPVDFELSNDGILTMTTDDGSKFTANIGAMIPVLTFEDSDTIAVSVSGTGVNKTYSFSIKAGSVTEDKLQPNFLADVKTEVAKAQASQAAAADSASAASDSATLAESYTHGGTGAREGEDIDNAKYYMEQAKAVSAVDIATTEKAGIVKPDGDTITIDPDGTIHGQSKVDEMTGATADTDGTSGMVPAPTVGQENRVLKGNGKWEPLVYDSELSAESENAPQTKIVEAKTKEIETNLSQLSNPNLLLNPDFRVNTKKFNGTASYEYTVDHWFSNDMTVTPNDGYLTLVQNGTSNPFFVNRFTDDFYKQYISEKVVTVSIKLLGADIITKTATAPAYKSNGGTASFFLDSWGIGVYSIEATGESGLGIYPNGSAVAIDIEWVKLELGSIATPFVPPNHDVELYKCLGASGSYSNPNLLINPDFKINQCGQSSYKGSNIYTVDRWKLNETGIDTIVVNEGYVTISSSSTLYKDLFQFVENYYSYAGKTVTLSSKIKMNADVGYIAINDGVSNSNIIVNKNDNWQILTLTKELSESLTRLRIAIGIDYTCTGTCDIEWVKLELGSVATPFIPPDPATELLKCQRYCFNPFYGNNTNTVPDYALLGIATAYSTTQLFITVPTPVSMRTQPTLVTTGTFVCDGSTKITIPNTPNNFTDSAINIMADIESGSLIKGTSHLIQRYGISATILFDAEIR